MKEMYDIVHIEIGRIYETECFSNENATEKVTSSCLYTLLVSFHFRSDEFCNISL